MSREKQRPTQNPSAFTAGEPKLMLGIAAVLGFIVVLALTRVFVFTRDADTSAGRHPLMTFNSALTGLH